MKIRSLLLGTVAAAGLTTGAFATDLGVETGLDVCDDLGLTGLTISSDTNCLQISGSVHFEYSWGDFSDDGSVLLDFANNDGYVLMNTFAATGNVYSVNNSDGINDSSTSYDAFLQFVATADSSFGPASAVIKLDLDGLAGATTDNPVSQLYVTIGEGTVFTAGKADSIFKDGEDEPLNFLGLFGSEDIDAGVADVDQSSVSTGGSVLQVVTSMDNFWIGGAVENLGSVPGLSSVVGVVAYNTDDIKAHASFAADGLLGGGLADWVFHSGFEGTFDTFKVVGAYGANSDGLGNALGSVSATFDTFTVAASGEYITAPGVVEWGVGGSIAAEVSDGVTLSLGARHYANDQPFDTLDQVAVQIVAAVSDEVTLTGEIGAIANGSGSTVTAVPSNNSTTVFYGSGKAEWNPGGDFKASLKGEVNSLSAYKITTTAEKSF